MPSVEEILIHLNKPSESDRKLITKAYHFAIEAHEGQKRYSNEPYASHVIAVARMLAEMGMGPRTITAALLHDTIEDTEATAETIRTEFGDEILFLVEGVTKLGSVRYYGSDRHNESLRKLFVATSQDIRVLIIKLMDRLHNMQTLDHIPKEKQERIARETLEIYVPVAHRLGMGRIRKELEDLAFPHVFPEDHERVCTMLEQKTGSSQERLERERKVLQKRLADRGLIEFQTSYRVKGIYSLYKKLTHKNWDIDRVYDLLAMRVVVDSIEDCYHALGIVHELWRPLPKRVKDYIAFPKPNGYQSIHTTVTSTTGTILEIQIRTTKMHNEAEYGVASHIQYKQAKEGNTQNNNATWFGHLVPSLFRPFTWRNESKKTQKKDHETMFNQQVDHRRRIPHWIQEIGDMYRETDDSSQFVADLRRDFFTNRIFVFTPNGDVVDLPAGATPIDFAYAIHSEIGDRTAGAKVNQKLVQLDSELKNGDIIEIETRKGANPTQKWLESAKTSLAKRRIRTALEAAESN